MRATVKLGIGLLAALFGVALYAASQAVTPPATHTIELGVPGVFTALHPPGFQDPINENCGLCHGADLSGGFAPSCFECHGEAWGDGGPPDTHTVEITGNSHMTMGTGDCYSCHRAHRETGGFVRSRFWHAPGLRSPFQNGCTLCHGPDLDGVGGFATSCFSCHGQLWSDRLPDQPPVADPDGPYSGTVGRPIIFDGTQSFDSDGEIVSYDWDFGDLSSGSGPSPSHVYGSAGSFDVTLAVTDDDGLTDAATTFVEVSPLPNLPPVADAGGPYASTTGEEVSFDGSGSFDLDGSIVFYLWDFGDGTFGVGPQATHSYDAIGTYPVTLTVTDNAGSMTSDTTTAEITAGVDPNPFIGFWSVRVPFVPFADFELEIESFGVLLKVQERFVNGDVDGGMGISSDDWILWSDSSGAQFIGIVNRDAGTMQGVVFNFRGTGTIWFAERL